MNNNPFKHIYEVRPCRSNPFVVVGATTEMNQAVIDNNADARDRAVQAGVQLGNLNLEPGDCITAAQLLQDPVLRLAFDLMLHCSEFDEESDEEADRN